MARFNQLRLMINYPFVLMKALTKSYTTERVLTTKTKQNVQLNLDCLCLLLTIFRLNTAT